MGYWSGMAAFAAAASVALSAPVPAVASTPASRQGQDEPSDLTQFQAGLEQMRSIMLAPGERVEGWDVGGANPDAVVRALGADRYYQLNRGESGTGVTILTDRPIADFAPAGWRIVDSYGVAAEALENPQLDFMPLSDRYVMAARAHTWERNDAGCWSNLSHALLYEIPGAPEREDDDIVPLMFRMGILAMEGHTICVRADGDPERGYTSRYFLPDGRILPMLSSPEDLLTIVPAAPVEQLIRAAPPRPAGSVG